MAKKPDLDAATLRVMERMVRTPPKPHEDMKLGRKRAAAKKRPKRKKKP